MPGNVEKMAGEHLRNFCFARIFALVLLQLLPVAFQEIAAPHISGKTDAGEQGKEQKDESGARLHGAGVYVGRITCYPGKCKVKITQTASL
jgi:hypothetical protein